MTTQKHLEHKQVTAHIRGRLKHEGIKARCSMQTYCGQRVISIVPPTADARFTDDEQRTIRTIALANRLTYSRGLPIDLERMADGPGAKFYMGYA